MNAMTSFTRQRRALQAALFLVAVASIGAANAQWKVIDNKANTKLQAVQDRLGNNGNVNGNLKDLYKQQTFSNAVSSEYDAKAEEPTVKLNKDQQSTQVNLGADKRCTQPKAQGIAQQQWQLCKEVVETQNAQYKYSLAMYEVTLKRQKRLDEIRKQRGQIGASETGKLQDNTNQLLALMSQMEIDRQQQKTYMDAYEARLKYLSEANNTLAKQAIEGNKGNNSLGQNVIGAAAGFVALKAALATAKTRKRFSH